jgi:4-amino-4-deoxy-L-arabinose transferase-like glycosyltransferase
MSKKGNKYLYLFGAIYALAILTRMQNLMFAPAFLIMFFLKEKFKFLKNKHFWITIGIFALIMIPQVILYTTHYGNPIKDILTHYFGIDAGGTTPVNIRTGATLFEYFVDLPYILGGQTIFEQVIFVLFLIGIFFFFIDMVLGFDKLFKNGEIQKKFFIFIWIVIPLLVLGYMTDYPEERYVTPMLMFLFLITLAPLEKAQKFLTKKTKISEKSSYILMFLVIVILFVPTLLWGFQLTDAKKASYIEVQQAGIWINQNSNIKDIIISPSQPQIQYYSQRSTYTEGFNETDLKAEVEQLKPKYLVLSAYEQASLGWLLNYTEQNNNTVIPVKAYPENTQQPTLIIYEFNYN